MDKIRKIIRKVIEESAPPFDLSNYDSAEAYAIESVDGVKEDMEEYEGVSVYIDRIYEYVEKYNQTISQDTVEIYRGVKLDSVSDLVVDPVGTYWSFEKDGTGDYHGSYRDSGTDWKVPEKDSKLHILTAIVNPKDINWRHGFDSFMWYGEDQWECSLDTGVDVLITHIDDRKLEKSLKAKS